MDLHLPDVKAFSMKGIIQVLVATIVFAPSYMLGQKAYRALADTAMVHGNYHLADSMYGLAVEDAGRNGVTEEMLDHMSYWTRCKMYLGESERAYQIFEEIAKLAIQNDIPEMEASAYSNLATFHNMRQEFAQMRELSERILAINGVDSIWYSNAHGFIGLSLTAENKLDSALHHFQIEHEIDVTLRDSSSYGHSTLNLANAYGRLLMIDSARHYFFDAIEFARSQNEGYKLASMYKDLADLFLSVGYTSKAREYAEESLLLAKEFGMPRNNGFCQVILGECALVDKAYGEARDWFALAIETGDQNTSQSFVVAAMLGDIRVRMAVGDNLIAVEHEFAELEQLVAAFQSPSLSQHLMIIQAEYYLINKIQSAAREKLNSLETALSTDDIYRQQGLQRLWAMYYDQVGDPGLALQHTRLYHHLSDSIDALDRERALLDMESKYQKSAQDARIKTLESHNTLSNLRLKNAQQRFWFLAIGFLIFAALLYWVYRLLQKTRNQNVIISKSLQEKEMLIREIHHRVKNNLQFISSLLSLQSEYVIDKQALSALVEGQNRVQSMAMIHQDLYQGENLTNVSVPVYMEKLVGNLFASYNISPDKVLLKMDIDDLQLDVDLLVPLGLIINELLSNALKHAFPDQQKGVISLSLREDVEDLILVIQDNGVGYDPRHIGKDSFGNRLVEALVTQVDGALTTINQDGTQVMLRVPQYKEVV